MTPRIVRLELERAQTDGSRQVLRAELDEGGPNTDKSVVVSASGNSRAVYTVTALLAQDHKELQRLRGLVASLHTPGCAYSNIVSGNCCQRNDEFLHASELAELKRLRETASRLQAAIVAHHSQRSDDRCWHDDNELYKAAGLPPADVRVGDKAAMLENCKRFIERRCEGGGWATYAQLEANIEELRLAIRARECTIANGDDAMQSMRTKYHDHMKQKVETITTVGAQLDAEKMRSEGLRVEVRDWRLRAAKAEALAAAANETRDALVAEHGVDRARAEVAERNVATLTDLNVKLMAEVAELGRKLAQAEDERDNRVSAKVAWASERVRVLEADLERTRGLLQASEGRVAALQSNLDTLAQERQQLLLAVKAANEYLAPLLACTRLVVE